MKTVFLRVLEAEDKATALLETVREPERARGRQRFDVDPTAFGLISGSPFAYWVCDNVRALFSRLEPFEAIDRTARNGLATCDDFRFVRLWWEVLSRDVNDNGRWFAFAKGGPAIGFYSDIAEVTNWELDGSEIKQVIVDRYPYLKGNPGFVAKNQDFYRRRGGTWSLRASRFRPRALPGNSIFSVRGYAFFCGAQEEEYFLALFNSAVFDYLFKLLLGRFGHPEFVVGILQKMPVPECETGVRDILAELAHRSWSLKRSIDTRTETSHAFTLPALLQVGGPDLAARAAIWSEHVRTVEADLVAAQAEIDKRCLILYGIDDADQHAIAEGFGTGRLEEPSSAYSDDADDDVGEDTEETEATADATGLAAELVAWAAGVAFGRFDVRLATGTRAVPAEPKPFDPLPACSPGMLDGDDGLPIARPPSDYPLSFPEGGVLVDDPGHARDLTAAVRAVFDLVFGADADRWWQDVAGLLDPKGQELCGWLASGFFEHHLKRYSKSRRKAPVLWQLGTLSGRYSVWLYAHRLMRDTFFQLQNQSDGIVAQKLAHEERQLTGLIQAAGATPSARERKEIAMQEAFVEELRAMLAELKRVAPLWNPNPDDGVVLTMAPLWRLVPQHKPWQKEIKSKWDELAAGKYEWAHVAMHLWPERVVPKCATDRSLAIAQGLEEVFWIEGTDGKWGPRSTPTRSIEEIVRERTSPAVKSALRSLLEAPATSGAAKKARKGRVDA